MLQEENIKDVELDGLQLLILQFSQIDLQFQNSNFPSLSLLPIIKFLMPTYEPEELNLQPINLDVFPMRISPQVLLPVNNLIENSSSATSSTVFAHQGNPGVLNIVKEIDLDTKNKSFLKLPEALFQPGVDGKENGFILPNRF